MFHKWYIWFESIGTFEFSFHAMVFRGAEEEIFKRCANRNNDVIFKIFLSQITVLVPIGSYVMYKKANKKATKICHIYICYPPVMRSVLGKTLPEVSNPLVSSEKKCLNEISNCEKLSHRLWTKFECDLCDAGYVGFTRRHLHQRVQEHKNSSSSIGKHFRDKYS